MGELWTMLDAAQSNPAGIPQELIDKKKEEIKSRRVRNVASIQNTFCIPYFMLTRYWSFTLKLNCSLKINSHNDIQIFVICMTEAY